MTRPRLGRNVRVLAWVSFFQDAATEMLYPVLPLYLTVALGASAEIVGIVEGLANGTAALLRGVSGRLADSMDRVPLVGAGYGIAAVAKLLLAFATSWPAVLAVRVLDRVGKGVRETPRDVIVAADTEPALRGRAFGYQRAFDSAGAVVGPLAGLALYELVAHDFRLLFLIAFLPAALSAALVAFVREPRRVARSAPDPRDPPARFSPRYRVAMVFVALFALANFPDALIVLRLRDAGFSVAGVMAGYALFNAAYSALSYPAGRIADRFAPQRVFAAGLALLAIAYFGFGLDTSVPLALYALLVVYGAFLALTDGVGRAWISALAPEARVGTGLGIYQAIVGGGSLAAGAWAGAAWGAHGTLPFLVSGALVALVAVALTLVPAPRRAAS